MQAPSSNELQILVLVGVIIVILLVRTIRLAKGVRFSLQRFMIRLGFYGFLFADVLAGEIYFDGLPWYSWVGDLVLAGVCALLFVPYAERTTTFFQDPKGGLRYRFPVYASMAYLLLYGVRLGLELLFVPGALEFSSTAPPLSPLGSATLEAVDGLFAVSAGLVFGRSVGVLRAWRRWTPANDKGGPLPSLPSKGDQV